MKKHSTIFLTHEQADIFRSLKPGSVVVANNEEIVIEDVSPVSKTGHFVTLFSAKKHGCGFLLTESILPGEHAQSDEHELSFHVDPFANRPFPISLFRGLNQGRDLFSVQVKNQELA